jgi:hypothetical protein
LVEEARDFIHSNIDINSVKLIRERDNHDFM